MKVGAFLVDHVRCGVGNGPVEEPVGSCGHRETLRTGLEREHFTGDDPGDRSPRAGEEEDVDADESDSSALRSKIGGTSNRTCNGDND